MLSGTETNLRINFIPGLKGFNPRLALIGFRGAGARTFKQPYHHGNSFTLCPAVLVCLFLGQSVQNIRFTAFKVVVLISTADAQCQS